MAIAISAAAQTVADNSKPATPVPAAAVGDTDALKAPLASAHELMKKKEFLEATAAYRAILEKNPASADAHAGLVRSLLGTHKIDDAREASAKALIAVPASALVHAAAGDVAFRVGRFSDAENEYRAAVKLDGGCARAQFGMGRMYEMVSMNKRAKDAYTRAHQLDSEDAQVADKWIETLPYKEALETVKKGEHPGSYDADRIAILERIVDKKPWSLNGEPKPTEIKLQPYGRELTGVYDINRNGPMNISKGYGVQVKFNDRAGATLLLDTGAGGITIGRKLAEKAGVVRIANAKIGGIGDQGSVDSYVAWVDKINIGNVEFHNCLIVVSSKSDVADEAGLLGPDVFEKYLITLDFHEQKMLLAPLPKNPAAASEDERFQDRYIAPEMQGFTRFYAFGHDIVVPVVVNDKAMGNFILDTGADLNTLSPKFAAQVTKATADDDYRMKGVSGKVETVLTGKKAVLQFAKMRI
ncbi:MAG TPA: aspartyl protease family protein, partial [Candidatus Angelobacter sp.]|nr:aspartyl protease family protein [Candidatus Angelobacter sp.]